MPPVRYGPDITDDAARTMNTLEAGRKQARALRQKGRKLSKKDRALLKKYDKQVSDASRLFGVSKKDIKDGNYGLIQQLARYGTGGKDKRGRAYKGRKFAKRRVPKLDKRGRRTGRMKSRVAGQSAIKASRRNAAGDGTERRVIAGDAQFGGVSQLGFTTPKGLQKLLREFDQVQKRRGGKGLTYEGRRVRGQIRPQLVRRRGRLVPGGGNEDINRVMTTNRDAGARGAGRLVTRGKAGVSVSQAPRPKKAKKAASAKRASGQNKKRQKAIEKATTRKPPTRKKSGGNKKKSGGSKKKSGGSKKKSGGRKRR